MNAIPEDLMRVLGRMEAKLDAAIEAKADHEGRLRSLEKTKWMAHGFAAAVGAGVSSVVTVLVTFWRSH